MFIDAEKCFMTGNGSIESKPMKINTDEISSVTECGYESRPYAGCKNVSMKNGDRFFAYLNIEELK